MLQSKPAGPLPSHASLALTFTKSPFSGKFLPSPACTVSIVTPCIHRHFPAPSAIRTAGAWLLTAVQSI